MFWEKGDGVIPVTIVPGSDWHKAGVSALALSSDNRLLLSGDKEGCHVLGGKHQLRDDRRASRRYVPGREPAQAPAADAAAVGFGV